MRASGAIRRLRSVERHLIPDHLLRLDPEDRQLRFGGYLSEAHIGAYCDRLDWGRAVAVGYLVNGEVRGLGELKPMTAHRAAEAALSVEKGFQNRGVGTELLRRLIVIARNRSIRWLHMLCLLENGKVLRMARKLGTKLTFDQGEVEGRLALPWPDHLTLLLELLDDASSMVAFLRPPDQSLGRSFTARSRPRPGNPASTRPPALRTSSSPVSTWHRFVIGVTRWARTAR
jgi:GNAT superfamily N-acetyltransferase